MHAWMNFGVILSWLRYLYFFWESALSCLRNFDKAASGSRFISSSPAKTGLFRWQREHLRFIYFSYSASLSNICRCGAAVMPSSNLLLCCMKTFLSSSVIMFCMRWKMRYLNSFMRASGSAWSALWAMFFLVIMVPWIGDTLLFYISVWCSSAFF